MVKKRFILAIFLVLSLLSIISVSAQEPDPFGRFGCCISQVGCNFVISSAQCTGSLYTFVPHDCVEEPACDTVACCHDLSDVSIATTRSMCQAIQPSPPIFYIAAWVPTTEISMYKALADQMCGGTQLPCSNLNCEDANTANCKCGSSVTSDTNPYCCGTDSAIFPNRGACTSSPSCIAGNYFDISGKIVNPAGQVIPGVTVRAGGKQVLTDENGLFTILQLPDLSSGSIIAIKNSSINSTTYTISGADLTDIILVLVITAIPIEGQEICDNGYDDDGDQFNWNSSLLEAPGFENAADWCDSDCNSKTPSIRVSKSVSRTYFRYENEWASQSEDFCSDNIDNDCDGLTDCQDPECNDNSPACKPTFCGDGTVQFPNAFGEYEQCDINTTGTGDDSLCPGKCIPPGAPNQCHCLYEAVCGNQIIDEPLEDCEGIFVASENRWDPESYNVGSDCTIDMCGLPNSPRPCQCPPPQICGNGITEEPEQCDLGNSLTGIPPASGNCDGCSPNCECPPEPIACANNLIEYGEDCDGTYDSVNQIWSSFKTRKYGCTADLCAPPLDQYLNNEYGDPIPGRSETTYNDILATLGVQNACTCPTVCKLMPTGPNLTQPQQVQYERTIDLEWTDECLNENVKTYNVQRCEASDITGSGCDFGGSWTTINEDVLGVEQGLGVVQNYADTKFLGSTDEFDKFYCYRIEGIYETLTIDTRSVTSEFLPEVHCIKAGREECFSFRDLYPGAEEFCTSNVRSMCDANNSIINVIDTEKVDCNIPDEIAGIAQKFVCVGPYQTGEDEGLTKCIPMSACDYCQDPFGLFAYSRSQGTTQAQMEYVPGLVSDYGMAPLDALQTSPRPQGWLPCFALEFCYMDRSYTSTDMFHSMPINGTSCYDYSSEESCLKDKMQVSNCEWAPHPEFSELGIGVCRSEIAEKQECERCHDPINRVFGKCDLEMCELYGRCYYDRNNLLYEYLEFYEDAFITAENPVRTSDMGGQNYYYKCRAEREISCQNYDSQEDCINSASSYSLEGATKMNTNVDIEVSGNMSGDVFNKLAGTNTLIQGSDDYFSFEKCAWAYDEYISVQANAVNGSVTTTTIKTNERCIKNSDDNPPSNFSQEFPLLNTTDLKLESDCENLGEIVQTDLDCRKDISPPVTTLPLYPDIRIAGQFALAATVNDDSLNYANYIYYPTTYACIAEEGMDCYPNGEAFMLGREAGNLITADNVNFNVSYNMSEGIIVDGNSSYGIKSGWYNLKWFSEDISHNLEPIRSERVYIDSDPPNVVLSFSNSSWEVSADIWRTNLSIDLNIVKRYELDDEFAFCNAKLYLGNSSVFPLQDIMNEYNNSWDRFYERLQDDYYAFYYRCEDDVGNVAEEWVYFMVDGDRSITRPKPDKTISNNQVLLQVETGTNSECRYKEASSDIPAYETEEEISDQLFQDMTAFEVTGTIEDPSTVHQSSIPLTHGFHRFYIKCKMFADDYIRGNRGDQIRFAIDNDAPSTSWKASQTAYNNWYSQDILVDLICKDPSIFGKSRDWKFGCDYTQYCIGLDCDAQDEYHLYTDPILLTQTQHLSFFSYDKGGNEESHQQNVLFQIDKESAEVSIDILEGDHEAEVIVLSNIYEIIVTSSKPIISPLVETPKMTFVSEPQKFSGTVDLLPTDNATIWKALFTMDNINANRNFEGTLTFEVIGHDHHNVAFSTDRSIAIDTKPPNMPIIDPSFDLPSPEASEYQMMPYPVHYVDGIYYTNQQRLKITGFTDEHLDIIGITSVDEIETERIFTQAYTNESTNLRPPTPGCCYGSTGCFAASSENQCTALTTFNADESCQEISACDVVACCHNTSGIPLANYRGACNAISPPPKMTFISSFTDNPTSASSKANILCGEAFTCNFASCENPNPLPCICGSSITSAANPYCCSSDSSVFSTSNSCSASPACTSTDTETSDTGPAVTYLHKDQVISGFETQYIVKIAGDLTNIVSNDHYVGFDSEQLEVGPINKFGYYGMFYDILSMEYFGGDEQYTAIAVYPPLEQSLALDQPILFYNKSHPTYWFGLDLFLTPYKENQYFIKAYDKAKNLVRYPPITREPPYLRFFYDPMPPQVVYHLPRDGSTSRTTFDFEVEIMEGITESGLDFNSTSFFINDIPVPYFIEEIQSPDVSNHHYKIYYPVYDIDDATYEVRVETSDLAMNRINESWTVIVDKGLPADPEFSIPECRVGFGNDTRWYCQDPVHDFVMDFSDERDNVSIQDVFMESSPTIGEAATCSETEYNVFLCTFTTEKTMDPGFFWADYGVTINAFKTLDDGTTSNTGIYGPFPFTVDNEDPAYNTTFNPRLRDNFNFTISAQVTNENHPLIAIVTLINQQFFSFAASSGNQYNFVLPVPDYSQDQEGPHDLVFQLMDSAGNWNTITYNIWLDLTAPTIAELFYSIPEEFIFNGIPFTPYPNITISGTFDPEHTDIEAIWVLPGDYNATSGTFTDKKFGRVWEEDDVMHFEVNVRLYDATSGETIEPEYQYQQLITLLRTMSVRIIDQAGHVTERSLRIIYDITAPEDPTFTVQST
ncbi:hypothetical protein ACFL0V_03615 [Nanoarchaeota archaeon]